MKMYKYLTGAAALLCSSLLTAQNVNVWGFTDMSSQALTQTFYHDSNTDEWTHSEPTTEYGSFFNGSTMLNLDAWAPYIDFHTGVWLGSGLGGWYSGSSTYMFAAMSNEDTTSEAYKNTSQNAVMTADVTLHFLEDQVRFHSGKFAGNGWDGGFFYGGWVVDQGITHLAMRGDQDQCFTGLEVAPKLVSGLKFIAGFPVAPMNDSYKEFDEWQHFAKSVKARVSYNWALYNVTFLAGVMPNYYAVSSRNDTDNYKQTENHTKKLFGEAFLQVDMPSLVYGMQFLLSYDVRWRDAETTTFSGEEVSKTTTGHYLAFSTHTTLIPDWDAAAGVCVGYMDDSYSKLNERAVFTTLGFNASHAIAGTQFVCGFNTLFNYMQDANGTYLADGYTYKVGDFSFESNFLKQATIPDAGEAGRYMNVYAYPYIQRNFPGGAITTGIEMNYSHFKTSNTTQAFSYRIPISLTFGF